MIKLIAFDWNGTLLADTQATLIAENQCLKELGYKPISLKKFQETFDIPIKQYWVNLGMTKEFFKNDMWKEENLFHKYYAVLENLTRTRVGAKGFLAFLEIKKIQRVIFSNHPSPYIVKQLLRLNIHQHFNEVLARSLGEDTHMHSRSKEQKLKDYIKKQNLKPKEVLVIGDTEEEIELGKRNGYLTAAATGGFNSINRLKKHKPNFIFYNFKDLIPIIKKLNKI